MMTDNYAKPNQDVVITKWIGLEATSILAKLKETELLQRFAPAFVRVAQSFEQYVSCEREKEIALASGASVTYEIESGGIFATLWKLSAAGKVGLEIDLKKIPIRQETVEVCEHFNINPYQMRSGGSLLIATSDGAALVRILEQEGIHAVIVGSTTGGNDKILRNGQEVRYLDRPQPDELDRILNA